jgi:hypothetical protein
LLGVRGQREEDGRQRTNHVRGRETRNRDVRQRTEGGRQGTET